jgi:uncharacterized protein (TIGR02118 family)
MVVKIIMKVYAKETMSKEEFVNHWLTKHAPLAKKKFGDKLKKYVINIVMSADGEEPGYQGTAELWFEDMRTLQKILSSPAFEQVMAAAENFARKGTMVILEEHTII